jgi:HAE1 family hydrophobic/amphiphilic exporter-1
MSMFVSFTMTPMLCSRFLKLEGPQDQQVGILYTALDNSYLWILRLSLRHRWAIVLLSVVTLFSTPIIFSWIGKDFVPKDDQSDFEVVMTLPEGYTLDRGNKLLLEIEDRLKQLRGVTHVFTIIGDTTGRVAKGQAMSRKLASIVGSSTSPSAIIHSST